MLRRFSNFQIDVSQISYKYKFGLDLKPGSETHSAVLANILEVVDKSASAINNRRSSWDNIHQSLNVYAPPDTAKKVREKDLDSVPLNASSKKDKIVIPTLFTSLEILMTNAMSILSQQPMFRYSPVDSTDYLGASFMEANIQHQYMKSKMMLDIYMMMRNGFAYGIGGGYVDWIVSTIKARPVDGAIKNLLAAFGRRNASLKRVTYEGSKITSIPPTDLILDPSISCNNVQDGMFIGHRELTNITSLLELEQSDKRIFNVKYLINRKQAGDASGVTNSSDAIEVIWLSVKIIPKAFGMGGSFIPEHWTFCVADRSVIIHAEPSPYAHGMFPYGVLAPTTDGSLYPKSLLEIIYPLHRAQNFLWLSKMASLKRSINMMLLVDPFVVETDDLNPDNDTGIVRLNDNAWVAGRIRDAILPIPYSDATAGNLIDMSYIGGMIDQVTGSGDPNTGTLSTKKERVAAFEISNAANISSQRFGKHVSIMSTQALHDIGLMMAYNTRQYMSKERYVQLTGKTKQELAKRYGINLDAVLMSAEDLDLDVDVTVNTPESGIGAEDLSALTEMFKTSASTPAVQQRIDLAGLLLDIMKKLGVKNAEQYDLAQVDSDKLSTEVKAGNLVPIGGENV